MHAVKPFLVVSSPSAVQRSPWIITIGPNELLSDPERIAAWAGDTNFRISCEVQLDGTQISADCGLNDDASFCLTSSWSTGAGRFGRTRQIIAQTNVKAVGRNTQRIEFSICGCLLDATLRLHLELTLARIGQKRSRLAPAQYGTRLWEDHWSIDLEETPAFPMQVADFTKFYPDKREQLAPWRISWNRQLDADFRSGVVLVLNSAHPTVVESFRTRHALSLEMALSDAIDAMLRHAVKIGAQLTHDDPNTVRGVMAFWADEIFGTLEIDDLAPLFERDPEGALARIRGWCLQ